MADEFRRNCAPDALTDVGTHTCAYASNAGAHSGANPVPDRFADSFADRFADSFADRSASPTLKVVSQKAASLAIVCHLRNW